MKRTIPWAMLAFYPLVAVVGVSYFGPHAETYLSGLSNPSRAEELITLYWWPIVFASVMLVIAVFFIAALRSRRLPLWARAVWAAAMVLFPPLVVPAYWWNQGEA